MFRSAALAGFLGVALGAFGAHGLKARLMETGGRDWWETATFYLLVHAVGAMALSMRPGFERAVCCFLAGALVFSGSLYIMAVTGMRWLGAITPVGGVLLLSGWVAVILARPAQGRTPGRTH